MAGKNLSQILKEADDLLNDQTKTASANVQPSNDHDEVMSLANIMMKEASSITVDSNIEETPIEKVAHACAIIETVLSCKAEERMQKVASKALEQGFSQEEVDEYMEKNAASFLPMHKIIGLAD